ncbi:MAG: DinB family protein [Balneolaceae bacterium]|nr:DinB family protein [Balneolaceae bacterium]
MEFSLDLTIEVLSRTPDTLSALLGGMSEPWIKSNEGGDTWSAFDIVGHLIHGEETDWIPRAKIILQKQTKQPFESFDRFAQFERFSSRSLNDLLALFRERREENLQTLKSFNLTPDELDLKGVHPELGEVTLRQLLATWTVHDLSHINQISRVMAKQYRGEVGPWREYIRLLQT